MRRSPHVIEELSAYIDGESRDADSIARHLQSCPDCARHHVQLLKLSGHLKALAGPDVHPAFVTRVVARTREVPRSRLWFPRLAPRWTAALVIFGLVATGAWLGRPGGEAPPEPPVQQVNFAWQDDAQVVEALAGLMDAGLPVDLFGDLDEPAENDAPDVALESVLESLAEASADEDYIDPFTHQDLDGMMDAFANEDTELLNSLLETDGNEV